MSTKSLSLTIAACSFLSYRQDELDPLLTAGVATVPLLLPTLGPDPLEGPRILGALGASFLPPPAAASSRLLFCSLQFINLFPPVPPTRLSPWAALDAAMAFAPRLPVDLPLDCCW